MYVYTRINIIIIIALKSSSGLEIGFSLGVQDSKVICYPLEIKCLLLL